MGVIPPKNVSMKSPSWSFQTIFYALSHYLGASVVVRCLKLSIDNRLLALSFKINLVNNLKVFQIKLLMQGSFACFVLV